MVAFPLIKLGALFVKQVSKPLANIAKSRAKSSPFFRTKICMPLAQTYHWMDVKMKMLAMNMGKPVAVPKLNEAMAIDLGAELLGEFVTYTIGAVILLFEVARTSKKASAEEEKRLAEMSQIQSDLLSLRETNNKLETEVTELLRILHVSPPPVAAKQPAQPAAAAAAASPPTINNKPLGIPPSSSPPKESPATAKQ